GTCPPPYSPGVRTSTICAPSSIFCFASAGDMRQNGSRGSLVAISLIKPPAVGEYRRFVNYINRGPPETFAEFVLQGFPQPRSRLQRFQARPKRATFLALLA